MSTLLKQEQEQEGKKHKKKGKQRGVSDENRKNKE